MSKPHFSRNHDGDLILVQDSGTTMVAKQGTALWHAIVGAINKGAKMIQDTPEGQTQYSETEELIARLIEFAQNAVILPRRKEYALATEAADMLISQAAEIARLKEPATPETDGSVPVGRPTQDVAAPIGMEPVQKAFHYCNKCRYMGHLGPQHSRPDGTGRCDYLAAVNGPWYSADQMAQLVKEKDELKRQLFIQTEACKQLGRIHAATDDDRIYFRDQLAARKEALKVAVKSLTYYADVLHIGQLSCSAIRALYAIEAVLESGE